MIKVILFIIGLSFLAAAAAFFYGDKSMGMGFFMISLAAMVFMGLFFPSKTKKPDISSVINKD